MIPFGDDSVALCNKYNCEYYTIANMRSLYLHSLTLPHDKQRWSQLTEGNIKLKLKYPRFTEKKNI